MNNNTFKKRDLLFSVRKRNQIYVKGIEVAQSVSAVVADVSNGVNVEAVKSRGESKDPAFHLNSAMILVLEIVYVMF